jgi:hypothetical protein
MIEPVGRPLLSRRTLPGRTGLPAQSIRKPGSLAPLADGQRESAPALLGTLGWEDLKRAAPLLVDWQRVTK